jgi:hypothetical protein
MKMLLARGTGGNNEAGGVVDAASRLEVPGQRRLPGQRGSPGRETRIAGGGRFHDRGQNRVGLAAVYHDEGSGASRGRHGPRSRMKARGHYPGIREYYSG